MKNVIQKSWFLLVLLLGISLAIPNNCQAQILKGFGKKVEDKVKRKVEEKADRHVDKTINTADKKTDESIEGVVKENKKSQKKENKPTKTTPKKLPPNYEGEIAVRKDQAMSLSKSNMCSDFMWFKKGSYYEYKTKTRGESKTQTTSMLVKDVLNNNGNVVSELLFNESVSGQEIEIPVQYVCEGDNIYMDMTAMFERILQYTQGQSGMSENRELADAIENTTINVDDGFTMIPKNLYKGMTLPDASFSMTTNTMGVKMDVNSYDYDRVVVGKETVHTDVGVFECMKIRSHNKVELNVMGMNQKPIESIDYLWLAPEIGMIKQETFIEGTLDSSIQLTQINR